jgi:hypothetical protein
MVQHLDGAEDDRRRAHVTARRCIGACAAGLAVGGCLALAGCGGRSQTTSVPASAIGDTPAPIPAGYRRVVNPRGGFTLAAPRRWSTTRHGATTVLRAPGGAAALSIATDRSRPALMGTLSAYARATLGALPGYENLRIRSPTPLVGQRYPAVSEVATGTLAATGVRQAILLVALRRRGDAMLTVFVFRRAGAPALAATVARIVGTLRTAPPQFGGPAGG